MAVKETIERYISNLNTQPFLFIGSGFSKRYLGTPNWEELLQHLASIINPTEKMPKLIFAQYKNKAETDAKNKNSFNEVHSLIASYMETDFKQKFYNENEFRENIFNKTEIENIINESINPFKYYICKYFGNAINNNVLLKDELEILKKNKIKIAGVITTNYDSLLESIFNDFTVYRSQLELINSRSYQFSELYKIHGCCSVNDSIVFTSEDYSKISKTNKYLAAKLLTIFVEFPIIFIGYSLNDETIRAIFQDISICLTENQRKELQNRIFFISKAEKNENDKIETRIQRFGNYDLNYINITLNDFSTLYASFEKISPKYRVDLARKLFKEITDIVVTSTTNNKIYASALQDPTLKGEQLACYIGTYTNLKRWGKGYLGISLNELYQDVILDDALILDTKILLEKVYPNLKINNNRSFFPIYKYKFHMNPSFLYFLDKHKIKYIKNDIKEVFTNEMNNSVLRNTSLCEFKNIKDICIQSNGNMDKTYKYILYSINNLNIDDVYNFLRPIFENLSENLSNLPGSSQLKKLVAAYDFIKNK